MREREREMDWGNPGTADKLTDRTQKRMVYFYETRFAPLPVSCDRPSGAHGCAGGFYALFPHLRGVVGKLLA